MRIFRTLNQRKRQFELTNRELKQAYDEYRDSVLKTKALSSILAIMNAYKLPSDSVQNTFLYDCSVGVVDHFLANLSWDTPLNKQFMRSIQTVFIPSLTHRYWMDLSAMPGDKPDIPETEGAFRTSIPATRRWMYKYVWNKPGGITVLDT